MHIYIHIYIYYINTYVIHNKQTNIYIYIIYIYKLLKVYKKWVKLRYYIRSLLTLRLRLVTKYVISYIYIDHQLNHFIKNHFKNHFMKKSRNPLKIHCKQ